MENKGHEVMVYLTYIIDHYPNLADISIFMHAHRFAWHNNELQNNDAAWMLLDLDPSHVVRRGYFNLRCAWDPGCPDWLHPLDPAVPDTVSGSRTSEMGRVALDKAEEPLMAAAFKELFPLDPVPKILSQPCCGQFALSRERIQAIPLARYVYFRDWLLRTELSDYLSGRVWEYLWHYLFTGRTVDCPSMRGCYCSGYGICFGGEMEFEGWFEKRWRVREREYELRRTEQLERLADEELGGQAKERKKGWWAQGKEKGNGKGNKMPGKRRNWSV
ncbi:hypothetical protein H2203_009113 [Taxawa tesnikishii (nom. ined.)]|nr:hypothetical protein H2203_009113 [Dothideales sp. JES 119]